MDVTIPDALTDRALRVLLDPSTRTRGAARRHARTKALLEQHRPDGVARHLHAHTLLPPGRRRIFIVIPMPHGSLTPRTLADMRAEPAREPCPHTPAPASDTRPRPPRSPAPRAGRSTRPPRPARPTAVPRWEPHPNPPAPLRPGRTLWWCSR